MSLNIDIIYITVKNLLTLLQDQLKYWFFKLHYQVVTLMEAITLILENNIQNFILKIYQFKIQLIM